MTAKKKGRGTYVKFSNEVKPAKSDLKENSVRTWKDL